MTKTPARSVLLLASLMAGAAATASGLDHAPVGDIAVTARGSAATIDVLANDPGVSALTELRVRTQPAHGSVAVVDRKLVYTPAPGFTGRDTLRYSIKTGRSFGIGSVAIDVGDVLSLQGAVTDSGGAADVVASVGPHRFAGQADGEGGYLLEVIGRDGDMVTLATGSGGVVLASVVGGFERLRAEAGGDGVLSRDENNQVQVTRLSAALAHLLQLANGGAPLAGEDELAAAYGALDTDVLLQMAAAIKLVADGDFALPDGVPDTMALIGDAAAYQQFIADVAAADPDALAGAVAATLSDPGVVPLTGAAAMVGARSMMSAGAGGNVRVGLIQGMRLRLLGDGSGQHVTTAPTADATATWTFVDGAARVVPASPTPLEYFPIVGGVEVRALQYTERLDITLLVDGGASGRDLVGVLGHVRTTYPDNPELADEFLTSSSTLLSYRDGIAEVPFLAGEFPAVRALQVHRPEIYGGGGGSELSAGSNYALHQFDAGGTGQLLDDGQAFTWSLDGDGRLALAYADGEVALLRRLLQDGAKGDGVMAEYQLPGGRSKALYTLSSVRDGSLAFDVANLARAWRSGFDISQTAYDFGDDYGFYIVLDGPAQTGSQVFVDSTGTQVSPLDWLLAGGTMVARRYWDDSGWVPQCTVGVNGCFLYMERRWVPVSRSGDRIYVHEELWRDDDQDGPLPLSLMSQRANFYVVEAPPPLP